MYEINLHNMTADRAVRAVHDAVGTALRRGEPLLKLIHGYGSSGAGGGEIKRRLPKELNALVRRNLITCYVSGENFNMYDAVTQKIVGAYYDVIKDPDYNKANRGVTVVLIR